MRSKVETVLHQVLTEKYIVTYEPKILYGSTYKLKVDFELKPIDGISPNVYLEYSGMNFFRKYYKILDVAKYNVNFYVIFDDEDLLTELEILKLTGTNLSELTLQKTIHRVEKFYSECKRLLI